MGADSRMDSATIIWSLLFGSIGLGYFIYGKKQSDIVVRFTGIALMIYPYFFAETSTLVFVGLGLLALPRLITTISD